MGPQGLSILPPQHFLHHNCSDVSGHSTCHLSLHVYMFKNNIETTTTKMTTKIIIHLCIGANVDVNVLRNIVYYIDTLHNNTNFTILKTCLIL